MTPATPQQATLSAGRPVRTVTDVGMRRAAKCPSLCVQSWMLISISSITCSNTDLSDSRALSLAALYPLCTLHQLAPGQPGSNCLVFMWLQVKMGPCLCWPRHFRAGLPSLIGHQEVGEGVQRGWANDIKATLIISLSSGWS